MDRDQTSRRAFVTALGAAAAGACSLRLAGAAAPSDPPAPPDSPALGTALAAPEPRAMNRRRIPRTNESIPVIGLGTSGSFDVDLDAGAKDRLGRVLPAFHKTGGRVVDTSPMYGRAEAVVGTLAAETRIAGDLFLATKVWTKGRDEGIRQMEASLRLLRRDRIELMQVHNLIDTATHLATLEEWRKEGRVRYTGITHYVPSAFDDLERVMREHTPDFVQLCYSVRRREAETRLLPLAADRGSPSWSTGRSRTATCSMPSRGSRFLHG